MVVLRYYEDLSEVQTAAVLGVSVGTVKSAVSRALVKLREDPQLAIGRPGGARDARAGAGARRSLSRITDGVVTYRRYARRISATITHA